ncbi:MAG: hypothetical protein LBD77_08760 [Bifidobacteriaceae bacterium]|jgi:hypothetical protein|nr:hypothetical protein [Bifidobacteriaceae bacterium]
MPQWSRIIPATANRHAPPARLDLGHDLGLDLGLDVEAVGAVNVGRDLLSLRRLAPIPRAPAAGDIGFFTFFSGKPLH